MSAEIITFTPKQKLINLNVSDYLEGNESRNPLEFLHECKLVLDIDDYRDLLCAIMDSEIYENLEDEVLRDIAQSYFRLMGCNC